MIAPLPKQKFLTRPLRLLPKDECLLNILSYPPPHTHTPLPLKYRELLLWVYSISARICVLEYRSIYTSRSTAYTRLDPCNHTRANDHCATINMNRVQMSTKYITVAYRIKQKLNYFIIDHFNKHLRKFKNKCLQLSNIVTNYVCYKKISYIFRTNKLEILFRTIANQNKLLK